MTDTTLHTTHTAWCTVEYPHWLEEIQVDEADLVLAFTQHDGRFLRFLPLPQVSTLPFRPLSPPAPRFAPTVPRRSSSAPRRDAAAQHTGTAAARRLLGLLRESSAVA